MAGNTFMREKAKILRVFLRRVDAGGKSRYQPMQFNIVSYDDNSGQYIEPVSFLPPDQTWQQCFPPETDADFYITDTIPAVGVTEFQ